MPPKKQVQQDQHGSALVEEITTKTPGWTHDEVFARYREQVPHNSDFTAPRSENLFPLPSFLANFLKPLCNDPRDYLCLELLINVLLTVVPAYIFIWSIPLWAPEQYQWLIHVAAPIFYVVCLVPPFSVYQRFILTLHVTSHQRVFPKRFDWANMLNEIFVNPFFGIPPGSYFLHHVVMHHRENNVFPRDMSSTMPYQRDSLTGLLSYIMRFWTHQSFYLGYYAFKTGRMKLFVYYCVNWTVYVALVWNLMAINPVGTTWMVLFGSVLTGFLLMQVCVL